MKRFLPHVLVLLILFLLTAGFWSANGEHPWRGLLGQHLTFAGVGFWPAKPISAPSAPSAPMAPPVVEPMASQESEMVNLEGTMATPHRLAKPKAKRVASAAPNDFSVPELQASVATRPGSEHDISLGFDAGTNYLFPTLRYQIAVTKSVALSAQFSYVESLSGSKVSAVGGSIGVAYYFEPTPFRGPFLDVGIGLYQIDATNRFRTSSATPLTYSSSLGVKLDVSRSFNLLAAVGIQYADNRGRNIGDIYFNGLMPLFKFGIGYGF